MIFSFLFDNPTKECRLLPLARQSLILGVGVYNPIEFIARLRKGHTLELGRPDGIRRPKVPERFRACVFGVPDAKF